MNHVELIYASWVKRDRMNMSLLYAACADSRDRIQLEAVYKTIPIWYRVPGTGPSLQEKQNKATRDRIRRAQRLGEDLIREDLCDEDDFSFSRTWYAWKPQSLRSAQCQCVSQTIKSAGTREGRYRPTRSKAFIDRLQTAKREKEELTLKSVDFSTAHERANIVSNIRKNSYQRVEIDKSPSCGCADSVKNSGKEVCKHIIWTVLTICRLPGNSNLLHQLFLTDNEALSVVGNSYSAIPQNLMYKKGTNKWPS